MNRTESDSPCRELSNDGLKSVVILLVRQQINYLCVSPGKAIKLYYPIVYCYCSCSWANVTFLRCVCFFLNVERFYASLLQSTGAFLKMGFESGKFRARRI